MATQSYIIMRTQNLQLAAGDAKHLHECFEYECKVNEGRPRPENVTDYRLALDRARVLREQTDALIKALEAGIMGSSVPAGALGLKG